MKWVIGIAAVVVVIVIVVIVSFIIKGWGTGNGDGNGDGSGSSGYSSQAEQGSEIAEDSIVNIDMLTAESESNVVEITINMTKIYYEDEELSDADALKSRITEEHTPKKVYQVNYKEAIKRTFDSVKEIMDELADGSLAITVTYNDNK